MITTRPPKIDTRKYLTQDELDQYDGMALAGALGGQTHANEIAMGRLEKEAMKRFALDFMSKGYQTTKRDRVFGWIANFILSFASKEYQFFLWVTYKVGLTDLGLEEDV